MTFRALLLFGAAAAFATAAGGQAQAQNRPVATAAAQANATIYNQLSFAPGGPLAFGLVKSTGVAGAVTVKPEGIRFATGGAVMVGSGPCHLSFCEDDTHTSASNSASYWGPGIFEVTGTPGASYRVSLPSAPIQASFRTPAKGRVPVLLAGDFRILALSTNASEGQLSSSGRDTFRIGATLYVPSDVQGAASYRVNVPIQLEYP